MSQVSSSGPRIAVIGAGFAGVAQAVKLRQGGFDDFTVFERGPGYGGVWRQNTYPGAEVDTPSHWYSFSFKQWDWPRTHGQQPELLAYINEAAEDHGLREKTRFDTGVTKLVWDERHHCYDVTLSTGEVEQFDVVISAIGLFNVPRIPDWPGLGTFRGPVFHTAQWDHDVDLSDKHVALVGTGSTGAQLSVALAPQVRHLTIFQRDPGWVTPKGERVLTEDERAALRDPAAYRRARRQSFWLEQSHCCCCVPPHRCRSGTKVGT